MQRLTSKSLDFFSMRDRLLSMHFSAPSHPLIQSFLLSRADFSHHRKIIVETLPHAEKLLKNIEALRTLLGNHREYRIINTELDAAEMEYDANIIGIYYLPLPPYFDQILSPGTYILNLTVKQSLTEEAFITWLVDHGYRAIKSDEVGTYHRLGDTVSVVTRKGLLQVSFFGTRIEEMFFAGQNTSDFSLFAAR